MVFKAIRNPCPSFSCNNFLLLCFVHLSQTKLIKPKRLYTLRVNLLLKKKYSCHCNFKWCVSASTVELSGEGSATNVPTPSSYQKLWIPKVTHQTHLSTWYPCKAVPSLGAGGKGEFFTAQSWRHKQTCWEGWDLDQLEMPILSVTSSKLVWAVSLLMADGPIQIGISL